jgi:hypothetical protein
VQDHNNSQSQNSQSDQQESSHRLSGIEIDERAANAQAILDSPVFQEAVDTVYSRVLGTLLNAEVGSLTASTAHATLKAVHQVRHQLEQFVVDKKMYQRFGQ